MIPSENVIVNPGQVMRVIPSAQDRPAAGEGEGGGGGRDREKTD